MTKQAMISAIVKLLAPSDVAEQRRLSAYHATRSVEAVRETYRRQLAIEQTTDAEIRLHCQFSGLPGMR